MGAVALITVELLLRLAQFVERRGGLRAAVFRPVGRGLPHGGGGLAHLAGGVGEILTLLFARQLFEAARRLLQLVGQLALARAAARGRVAAGGRHAALPLGFLLLPPGELLQLFRELVNLAIVALLLGPLLHLVLVRELVELELEQIGEILGELTLTAATPTASALPHLRFVVLLGILKELERALLGRQRFLGLLRLQIRFGGLHFSRRLRQRVLNDLEGRIDDAQARLELADQFVHLRAQFGLREVEEHDVLAELLGRELRLVAHGVERRRDDLPLLF